MNKLVDVLNNPKILIRLSQRELSNVIAEARYFNMLAQLQQKCQQHGIWDSLPKKCQQHLESASVFYLNQQKKLKEEAEEVSRALSPLKVTWVYLKGGAYHLNNMDHFAGRMMNDLDILVEEDALPSVETALHANGWVSSDINNYDEKFYRHLSQEIPPLRHIYRQVELDVHFNILPKTLKDPVDGRFLFEQSTPLKQHPYQKVLKPHAMLIHSAIHLFYESEYHKGLRDLYDINIFIKHYSKAPSFWDDIIKLHHNIGNQQSVYLALRYCNQIFGTKTPSHIQHYYDEFKPNAAYLRLLDFCFLNLFTAMYPPLRSRYHWFSETVLYLRGHLKRMPLRLLIPHLTKKSLDKLKTKEEVHDLI